MWTWLSYRNVCKLAPTLTNAYGFDIEYRGPHLRLGTIALVDRDLFRYLSLFILSPFTYSRDNLFSEQLKDDIFLQLYTPEQWPTNHDFRSTGYLLTDRDCLWIPRCRLVRRTLLYFDDSQWRTSLNVNFRVYSIRLYMSTF